MPPAPRSTPPALVLLGCGSRQQIEAVQQQAAAAVARTLGLQLAGPIGGDGDASDGLGILQAGSLTPLVLDPGLPLAGGGHWAETLGAWRQSALLLLSGAQLESGTPAAATALLRQWQVPLLGLVQWGGDWDTAARHSDGLPWLGWLDAAADSEAAAALALAAAVRWRQLDAELG
jgi:hypothetical protein